MIPPHEAAWEVHEVLTRAGLRYAIIGGVAIQHWGEPRLTVDLDVTVAVPLDQAEGLVRALVERFTPRHADPIGFARQTRGFRSAQPTAARWIFRWPSPATRMR